MAANKATTKVNVMTDLKRMETKR